MPPGASTRCSSQRAFLVGDVVDQLVAENHVDRGIGQVEARDRAALQFDRASALPGRRRRTLQQAGVDVDADDLPGRKCLLQQRKHAPLPAADVHQTVERTGRIRARQLLQIGYRAHENPLKPHVGAEKPPAEGGIGDPVARHRIHGCNDSR